AGSMTAGGSARSRFRRLTWDPAQLDRLEQSAGARAALVVRVVADAMVVEEERVPGRVRCRAADGRRIPLARLESEEADEVAILAQQFRRFVANVLPRVTQRRRPWLQHRVVVRARRQIGEP